MASRIQELRMACLKLLRSFLLQDTRHIRRHV